MSDTPNLSRRDWFRLRLPHQDQWLGETPAPKQAAGLQAIEHPPNYDGMNLDELPPLREAMLSDAEVVCLLDDIKKYGSDIQLMQKRSAQNSRADVAPSSDMTTAKEMFLNRTVNRLQIRYRWQQSLWIDTLARQESATRLVRVAHDERRTR